jgi:molecular chaperone DnaK
MPRVQEEVERLFGKAPRKDVNPDEAVAAGAAVQGAVLGGDRKDVLLLDVTPLSLGIETMGGIFTKLISKNTTIPTKHSQVFSTAEDNQPAVTIKVAQGEREMFAYNKSLGEFNLEGIAPARRGMPQIEVTLDIDANGIMHVSAKDKNTGKENKITIKANSGLTDEEIQQMVKDAEVNADADKKLREIIETRNQADAVLHTTKNDLKDVEDKLTEEQKTSVNQAITDLESVIAGDDKDVIVEKMSNLFTASQVIQQAKSNTSNAGGESTTVDAEFKEVKDAA